jgi:hypothetical protein
MREYPPKLLQVKGSDSGSAVKLSDGRTVLIDIRPERLDRALKAYERPSLEELPASRSLEVFADTWQTPEQEWGRISEIIHISPIAVAKLRAYPGIWKVFGQRAEIVRELPQRVYGGLERALYTSDRFQFRKDLNRPIPWCCAHLNATGGWVFEMWVHLGSGQVGSWRGSVRTLHRVGERRTRRCCGRWAIAVFSGQWPPGPPTPQCYDVRPLEAVTHALGNSHCQRRR